jgi:hypothetical protein
MPSARPAREGLLKCFVFIGYKFFGHGPQVLAHLWPFSF